MNTTRRYLSLVSLVFATLAAGCAATPAPAAPAQPTSATYASVETTGAELTVAPQATEIEKAAMRHALERRIVTALKSADVALDGLRNAAHNTTVAAERQPIDDQIVEAEGHKAKLFAALEQLEAVSAADFASFRNDVDGTIWKLAASLGNQREKANVPSELQATQGPRATTAI